jgi:AcrR family transcriptional regulator
MSGGTGKPGPEDSRGVRLESAQELVLRAYAAAKAAGRPDWRSMTIAVLKNRLLSLTDRSFDEADWGATTMQEFVKLLTPMVSLDLSTRPPSVVLASSFDVNDQPIVAAASPPWQRGEWRIRQDLWDAVVDCVSGQVYTWDGVYAVPHSPEEAADSDLLLPTVTPDELGKWRSDFANEIRGAINPALQDSLETWRASSTSSQMLPQQYRNRWYGVLKRHVRARLDSWFEAHSIDPPADWIISSASLSPAPSDDIEHLRNVALRAVRAMTRTELESLDLPASVVARMYR